MAGEAEPIGTKIYISTAQSAALSASAYAALTWTQIKDVDTIPAFGPAANVTKFTPLETGVVNKRKGSIDNGDPELVCFINQIDAGQLACVNAAKPTNKSAYAFKVEIPDAVSASHANSVFYFNAIVSQSKAEPGSADNVPRRRFMLGVTTIPVEVPTV